MEAITAFTLFLAIFQITCASTISKLATGTASGFYHTVGTPAAQIAAVGDPQPSTIYFNSGGFAPQYLQLELPCLYTVHNIFLQTAYLSASSTPHTGHTIHELYAGNTTIPTKLVARLDGNTTSNQWIHVHFYPPLTDVRFLRLHTSYSESWVAWKKFLVF
ncbi:hypothetical protein Bhyg_08795 [Pseudolycoriella hygida]|uniref:Uncharacterized protein n=1 Tax=Pseudolycoriella hygida TaxID=35572 RepID=A0A9Q0S5A7_9DIPT|nr:hypothetical protein Bhyg_08795 [Pseudolycoriella hygida]